MVSKNNLTKHQLEIIANVASVEAVKAYESRHKKKQQEIKSRNLRNTELLDRSIGTLSEDLWDVVTVDTKNRQVKMFRFGSGEDREFSY